MIELLVKDGVQKGNTAEEVDAPEPLKSVADIDFNNIIVYDLSSRDEKNNEINIAQQASLLPINYALAMMVCRCDWCE